MSEALLRRRRLMMMLLQGGGGLPDDYQELQWVASNGERGNVVDTLISAPSGVFVVGRVSFQNVSGYQVNGAEDAYPYARNYPIGVSSGGQWYLGADGYWTSGSVAWGQAYDIEASTLIGDIHLNVDGVSVIRQTAGNDRSAKNLYLFGSNGYNNVTKMTIYGHLFYYADSDRSNLIAEFVPCKRKSDDAVGLYDIKRGIFLLPASVALTAGPIVSEIPVGVGIKTSAGYLLTADYHALADKPSAVGVYVYDGTHLVIVHPTARSRQQYSPRTLIPDAFDASTHAIAITDFDGEGNTLAAVKAKVDGVISFAYLAEWARGIQFSDGNEGHIPSAGELWLIRQNITDINDALTEINGTLLDASTTQYGCSTQYGEANLWRTTMNGGVMTNAAKNGYYNAFAVTNKR